MSYVDIKFAGMLSAKLDRFEVKSTSPYKANFRCPLCGDSQKSKTKARGWLLQPKNNDGLVYYCHNCGASTSLAGFLKSNEPVMYNDYITEKFKDNLTSRHKSAQSESSFETKKTPSTSKKTKQKYVSPLKSLKKISQLKADHPAKKYITDRKIPPETHYRIYYAPKFKEWVNSFMPGKFKDIKYDEPRIILPFVDKKGRLFGLTGRSMKEGNLRYITIMAPGRDKIFGLDSVDFTKPYKVLEGAFDSFFIKNSVAMAGADSNSKGLEHLENATYVLDNEPRNKEIVKRMSKLLDEGRNICIWPNTTPFKDINDGILDDISADHINKIIEENTYSGLEGKLALGIWKRC